MSDSVAGSGQDAAPVRVRYSYHLDQEVRADRSGRFLAALTAILEFTDYRSLLDAYGASIARCSRCATACPVYLETRDPRDIPCYRANLLLDVYKRYFTPGGRLRARLGRGGELTAEGVDEMAEVFWRCNACRRCTLECPLGIDHGLIVRLGRYALATAGISPRALQVSVREQLEGPTGNTSKIPLPALRDTLEFLAGELDDSLGVKVSFPVDRAGREYIFFCAVSDYIMEPDTLLGNAAVLYAAGDWDNWTIGTGNFDGINYGLFYSDWHLERIVRRLAAEAARLDARRILIGECGHASRSAKEFVPVFGGAEAPPVTSFIEYTLGAVSDGRVRLDPGVITEAVTYHDPCNISRSGWLVDEPRELLKSFVPNYVEMEPARRGNYCCGGGGGLVSLDETHGYRMEVSGRRKAEQIRATGAGIVVAPCANCKKQLRELVAYHKLPCRVLGIHDLVLQAIEIPGAPSAKERREAGVGPLAQ